jgi:hypothetical protein
MIGARSPTPESLLRHAKRLKRIVSEFNSAPKWRFTQKGESVTVSPSGPRRVNTGDAAMPALLAGIDLGILPAFHFGRRTHHRPAGETAAGLITVPALSTE